jgi:hypothetical protein
LYNFVGNNPVNFIDPYGLYTWPYTVTGWAGVIVSGVGIALLPVSIPVGIGVAVVGAGIQVYDFVTIPDTVKKAADDCANKSVRPYFNNRTSITNHIDQ